MQNHLGSLDLEAGAVGWGGPHLTDMRCSGANNIWHLFLCLALCVPSLDNCLLKSLVHLQLNCLFIIELQEFFILDTRLSDTRFAKNVFHSTDCLFMVLTVLTQVL